MAVAFLEFTVTRIAAEFDKRIELLIRVHNKTLSVVAMRVSRSHDAVIRYDELGNVIETHEHAGEIKEP